MNILKLCTRAAMPIAFAVAVTTLGCGGSSSYSYVKVIHASPGAPNVDVKVGGDFATQNLAFGSASASYTKVHAGTSRNVQVFAAGKDSSALLSAQQTLMKSQYYTVIALNTPANLQAKIENDDLTPPTTGDFKLRVVHGASTAGNVDVYVTAPGVPINDPKNPVTPVLSNFAFGTVTSYLEVPAGTYEVRVTPTGDPSTVAIDTGAAGVVIPAGAIFTAVALDPNPNTTGSTFSLLLTQDQPVAGVTPTAPSSM
jgi:hypothetical protein